MRKFKFLIVDDFIMNRVLLKEIIQGISEIVFEAKNGLEALKILENNKVDIVLMDIEMPKMNGLETTKHIRTIFQYPLNQIPIIALTAHNPKDFFDDFKSVGFDELITKPYSFEKVLNAISFYSNL